MKITNLPPDLHEQIADMADELSSGIESLTTTQTELSKLLRQDLVAVHDHQTLLAKGGTDRKTAADLNAIATERGLIAGEINKLRLQAEGQGQKIKARMIPMGETIRLACTSLYAQIREQYVRALAPFYFGPGVPSQLVEDSEAYGAIRSLIYVRTMPLQAHEPESVLSFAQGYLGTLKAIRDGKDVVEFTGYSPDDAAQALTEATL